MSDDIKARKLLAAAQTGDIDLLKSMKTIQGGKKGCMSTPECVDGAEGPDEIVEKFREVYETLYNSTDSSDAVAIIKEKLDTCIGPNMVKEVNKVTGRAVK